MVELSEYRHVLNGWLAVLVQRSHQSVVWALICTFQVVQAERRLTLKQRRLHEIPRNSLNTCVRPDTLGEGVRFGEVSKP